uniref:Zinc finger protein 91-like n=1 Tax=Erpetoichthys calabaricus TaxID=27687 RepID=A0A8C4TKP8_ERPCA
MDCPKEESSGMFCSRQNTAEMEIETVCIKEEADCIEEINSPPMSLQCHECMIIFTDSKLRERHMRKKHPEEYQEYILAVSHLICHVCELSFGSSRDLIDHQRREHPEGRPFQCPVCGDSFVQSHALINHKRRHLSQSSYVCQNCGKTCKTLKQLMNHRRKHNDLNNVSSQCKREKKSDSPCHERGHSLSLQCLKCFITFKDTGTSEKHMRFKHPEEYERQMKGQTVFACHRCDKTFPSSRQLSAHQRTHRKVSQQSAAQETNSSEPDSPQESGKEQETEDIKESKHDAKREAEIFPSDNLHSISYECPHCNFLFSNLKTKKRHMNAKHPPGCGDPLPLLYGEELESAVILDPDNATVMVVKKESPVPYHSKSSTEGQQYVECPQCFITFEDQDIMESHMLLKHPEWQMKDQTFEPPCQIGIHHQTHRMGSLSPAGKKVDSSVQELVDQNAAGCETHKLQSEWNNKEREAYKTSLSHKCLHCKFMFRDLKTLEKHVQFKHNLNSAAKLTLTSGSGQFGSLKDQKQDITSCTIEERCVGQSKQENEEESSAKMEVVTVKIKDELTEIEIKHSSEDHQDKDVVYTNVSSYKCLHCNFIFNNPKTMQRHMNAKHWPSVDAQTDTITPNLAQRAFPGREEAVTFPVKVELPRLDLINQGLKEHINDSLQCSACGVGFRDLDSKEGHGHTHTSNSSALDERIFSCHVCDQSFSSPQELLDHQQSQIDSHPFKCLVCGDSFKCPAALSSHKRDHLNQSRYICSDCGMVCLSLEDFLIHRRLHTEERPYTCEDCGKTFKRASGMQRHKSVHSAQKQDFNTDIYRERSLECPKCLILFVDHKKLESHQCSKYSEEYELKVKGKSVLACEHCGQIFDSSFRLDIHLCNQVMGQKIQSSPVKGVNEKHGNHKDLESQSTNKQPKTYDENKNIYMHRCLHCNFDFNNLKTMQRHMNAKHWHPENSAGTFDVIKSKVMDHTYYDSEEVLTIPIKEELPKLDRINGSLVQNVDDECDQFFVYPHLHPKHQKRETGRCQFKCLVSGDKCKCLEAIDSHKQDHLDPLQYVCSDCGQKSLECPKCLTMFRNKETLESHLLFKHLEEYKWHMKGQIVFTCPHCKQIFYSSHQLSIHQWACIMCKKSALKQDIGGDLGLEENQDLDTKEAKIRQKTCTENDSSHKCPQCNLIFSSCETKQEHVMANNWPPENSRTSSDMINLKKAEHIFPVRGNILMVSIKEDVTKLDAYSDGLEEHISASLQRCTRGIEFRDPDAKDEHYQMCLCNGSSRNECIKYKIFPQEIMDDQQSQTDGHYFQCLVCGDRFKCPVALTSHKQEHLNQSRYVCSDCGKLCLNLEGLLLHQRLHTEERPYTCEDCGKTFKRACGMQQHKSIHSGVQKKDSPASRNIHSQRSLECPKCSIKFRNEDKLESHLLFKHPEEYEQQIKGQTVFTCPRCNQTFDFSHQLSIHQCTHMTGKKLESSQGSRENMKCEKNQHFNSVGVKEKQKTIFRASSEEHQ